MNQQPQSNKALKTRADFANQVRYPINHFCPQSIEQATAAKRGLAPEKSGILRKPHDPVSKCFQELLLRAADSADRMYAVSESMLDKNPCLGKSIRTLEPPSNWKNWENYNLYENKAIFFNVRNFK